MRCEVRAAARQCHVTAAFTLKIEVPIVSHVASAFRRKMRCEVRYSSA
jgi:hypothetical protein